MSPLDSYVAALNRAADAQVRAGTTRLEKLASDPALIAAIAVRAMRAMPSASRSALPQQLACARQCSRHVEIQRRVMWQNVVALAELVELAELTDRVGLAKGDVSSFSTLAPLLESLDRHGGAVVEFIHIDLTTGGP